jgi:hypothetical protein
LNPSNLTTAIQTSQLSSSLVRMDYDKDTQWKWHKHLKTTPPNDPTNGLSEGDVKVLLQSEPVKSKRAVYFYHGEKHGECDLQKTAGQSKIIEKLIEVGLIHPVEFVGGLLLHGFKMPINPKATIWAYTTVGIQIAKHLLGVETFNAKEFKVDEEYMIHVSAKELEVMKQKFIYWLNKNQ